MSEGLLLAKYAYAFSPLVVTDKEGGGMCTCEPENEKKKSFFLIHFEEILS